MTLNIELLAAGTRPPAWIDEGFREYVGRLPRDWQVRLIEIAIARRSRNTNTDQLRKEEAGRMLDAIKPGAIVIALDTGGNIWSTQQLATNLSSWHEQYGAVQLLIGGPDGLDNSCLERASQTWSLSNLTFPHFMVRMIVAEQVYRAWSILNNHPYHR